MDTPGSSVAPHSDDARDDAAVDSAPSGEESRQPAPMTVDELLAGPRGRRLCLEIAVAVSEEVSLAVFRLADGGTHDELAAALETVDTAVISPEDIRTAFSAAIGSARYWQDPDDEDFAAEQDALRPGLERIAAAVLASGESAHWGTPAQAVQHVIRWKDPIDGWTPAPDLTEPAPRSLDAWTNRTRAEEAAAEPVPPDANVSGEWWSTPDGAPTTVGFLPEALDRIEDDFGWDDAETHPVSAPGARVVEIRTADDWAALCARAPLEVTDLRAPDWRRATGRSGRWVIPDFAALAREYDGVHLTTAAYLSSAGRPIPVDLPDAHADRATASAMQSPASLIAGWDPDTTVWLTRALRRGPGPVVRWRLDDESLTWGEVAPAASDAME